MRRTRRTGGPWGREKRSKEVAGGLEGICIGAREGVSEGDRRAGDGAQNSHSRGHSGTATGA